MPLLTSASVPRPTSEGKPEPCSKPIDASVSYEEARKRAIAAFERSYLEALLDRSQGNVSRAARDAGMDRVYLHRLIRRHALR